jgi:hypothetical protein
MKIASPHVEHRSRIIRKWEHMISGFILPITMGNVPDRLSEDLFLRTLTTCPYIPIWIHVHIGGIASIHFEYKVHFPDISGWDMTVIGERTGLYDNEPFVSSVFLNEMILTGPEVPRHDNGVRWDQWLIFWLEDLIGTMKNNL